jgi:hypothetical protein
MIYLSMKIVPHRLRAPELLANPLVSIFFRTHLQHALVIPFFFNYLHTLAARRAAVGTASLTAAHSETHFALPFCAVQPISIRFLSRQ